MFVPAFCRCIPHTISIPTIEPDRVKSARGPQPRAFACEDLSPACPTKLYSIRVCGDCPEDVAVECWTLWVEGKAAKSVIFVY